MRRFLSAIVALLLTFFVLSLPSELDEARDPRCRALSPRSVFDRDNCRLLDRGSEGTVRSGAQAWRLLVVTDMDKQSRVVSEPNTWRSVLKYGVLRRSAAGVWDVQWRRDFTLYSQTSAGGRSMELSELVLWRNRLFAMCDITGIVYKVVLPLPGTLRDPLEHGPAQGAVVFQRWALASGDGNHPRAFKSEWATVKDSELYIGSLGKEWVEDGQVRGHGAEWIKKIDCNGHVTNVNWGHRFGALRAATNTSFPGYLSHEAVLWDAHRGLWSFFPRKVNPAARDVGFSDADDETLGSNLAIHASEDISSISVSTLGPVEPEWGFTSAKLVPFAPGVVAALKGRERTVDGVTSHDTVLVLYDLDTGESLMDATVVGASKFEGLSVIPFDQVDLQGLDAILLDRDPWAEHVDDRTWEAHVAKRLEDEDVAASEPSSLRVSVWRRFALQGAESLMLPSWVVTELTCLAMSPSQRVTILTALLAICVGISNCFQQT